jgi:hypothetical protein
MQRREAARHPGPGFRFASPGDTDQTFDPGCLFHCSDQNARRHRKQSRRPEDTLWAKINTERLNDDVNPNEGLFDRAEIKRITCDLLQVSMADRNATCRTCQCAHPMTCLHGTFHRFETNSSARTNYQNGGHGTIFAPNVSSRGCFIGTGGVPLETLSVRSRFHFAAFQRICPAVSSRASSRIFCRS